jgi:hypothetical protein
MRSNLPGDYAEPPTNGDQVTTSVRFRVPTMVDEFAWP